MVCLKVWESWAHVGATRLLRALLLDGAIYFLVVALTFGLDIVANMSSKVGGLQLH
jgi:hypothetical protein